MELTYDSDANALRLRPSNVNPDDQLTSAQTLDAILDIGEGGRLIGVEFPAVESALAQWLNDPTTLPYVNIDPDSRAYIEITPPLVDGATRSTPISITAHVSATDQITTIDIPRRGNGYEISYPSGNQ